MDPTETSAQDRERLADVLRQMRSLGDNCEFGFVQRAYKAEVSGLMRWSVAPPDKVLALLHRIAAGRLTTAGFYHFEGITPYSKKMILEADTGFCFHSVLVSDRPNGGKLVFSASEAERRALHHEEREKFMHFLTRFVEEVTQRPCLYAIRLIPNMDSALLRAIHTALRGLNPGNALLGVGAWDSLARFGDLGAVPGLRIAGVGKLAPYAAANEFDPEGWTAILRALAKGRDPIDGLEHHLPDPFTP